MDNESNEQLTSHIKELNDTISILIESMDYVINSQNKFNSNVNKNNEEIEKFDEHIKSSNTALSNLDNNIDNSSRKARIFSNLLHDSATALDNLTGTVLSNTDGLSKYTKTVDSAGDAVSGFAQSFGPLGQVVGLVVKAFTMLFGANLEMRDGVVNATDALFSVGGAGSYTAKELRDLARNSEVFYDNLDILVKPLQRIGPSIMSLGGSAGEAQKRFIQLSEDLHEEGILRQLRMIGIDQEQIFEDLADFVQLQNMAGLQISNRFRTEDQLMKASLEYSINLRELAQLTGKNVEDIKKEQQAALMQEQLQIKIFKMQQEGAALVLRGQEIGGEEGERLIEEGQRLQREANATVEFVRNASSQMPGIAAGLIEFIATGGNIVGEASSKLAVIGLPLDNLIEQLRKGNEQYGTEFANVYRETIRDLMESPMGEALILSQDLRELILPPARELATIIATTGMDLSGTLEEISAMIHARMLEVYGEDYMATIGQEEESRRKARSARDELVATMDGIVTRAFSALSVVVDHVTNGFYKLLSFLGIDSSVKETRQSVAQLSSMYEISDSGRITGIRKKDNENNIIVVPLSDASSAEIEVATTDQAELTGNLQFLQRHARSTGNLPFGTTDYKQVIEESLQAKDAEIQRLVNLIEAEQRRQDTVRRTGRTESLPVYNNMQNLLLRFEQLTGTTYQQETPGTNTMPGRRSSNDEPTTNRWPWQRTRSDQDPVQPTEPLTPEVDPVQVRLEAEPLTSVVVDRPEITNQLSLAQSTTPPIQIRGLRPEVLENQDQQTDDVNRNNPIMNSPVAMDTSNKTLEEIMSMVVQRLDDVVYTLQTNNDIQDKILLRSMV